MFSFWSFAQVVLAWFVKMLAFFALAGSAGGCSLAAAWAAPSQQQVTNPTAPTSLSSTQGDQQAPGAASKPSMP